eukprot:CAMPEP_0116058312 /NCGR_PEP_ID=MMETSP0322-20121206/5124_1 /TAXON_ID=163516 /ORGANISM="Leptocylindrus danicus var. apora, Strain B651" /LENGTH=302 /DNA_ID=CAMNT_0003542475 /DNA_START=123 /DNA_END=1031 /DNA_ORIENTATION=-
MSKGQYSSADESSSRRRSKGHSSSAEEGSSSRRRRRRNRSSGGGGGGGHTSNTEDESLDLFGGSRRSRGRWLFPDEALQNALIILNLVLAASWLLLYTLIFLDRSGYISLQQMKFLGYSVPRPKLCSDGITHGYTDWSSLRTAVQATSMPNRNDDDVSSVPFVICSHTTLTGGWRDTAPIFINAPDIVIECGQGGTGKGCIVDRGGSHMSFGPYARGIVIRGITFRGARTTSQVFYYDDAEVTFEDCSWEANGSIGRTGAVVDINSVSTVYFNRCDASEAKQIPRQNTKFGGSFGSSISIRK